MERLYDYAESLSVQVEFTDLSHLKRNGDYCDELKLVRVQSGMQARKTRHILGHELGHATHHDVPSMFPHIQRKQELRADEWAAWFLIDPVRFSEVEEQHGGHLESMAVDLHVLRKTVEAFKRTLLRVGDDVYAYPRMGVGQWHRRMEAIS